MHHLCFLGHLLGRCVCLCVLAVAFSGCCGDAGEGGDGYADEEAQEDDEGEEEGVASRGMSADLGFRPGPHGFGFENYGNDGIKNLTSEEVAYLFGEDEVCAGYEGDTCLLTPAGRQWMEEINSAMEGGHCEGMAVLSLLLYAGKSDIEDFGDVEQASELDVEGNPLLQRELALWFATQGTSPTVENELRDLSPAKVVKALRKSFKQGKEGPLYSLGIYKPDMSGGHAMTPYAIKAVSDKKAEILVYDNNHPGKERRVSVNLAKNTWRYIASTNPDEPESVYLGDATTRTLTLTPMEPRLAKQRCPFCGEAEYAEDADWRGFLKGNKVSYMEVWLDGAADLLLTDDKGNQLGMKDGKLVSTIPGARAVAYRGDAFWNDALEPVYQVPIGTPLTMTLDGSRLKEPADSEVTLIAPGYTLEVDGVLLEPGQKDTITVARNLQTLSYETHGPETPELLIGVTRPEADFEFIVVAGGDDDGHAVVLELDLKNSALAIAVIGREGESDFDIEMARIDDTGEDVFIHEDTATQEGAVFYIDFADWEGDGTPMTLRVDEDGDGDIDGTEEMEDR